jgi:hypothetical protein
MHKLGYTFEDVQFFPQITYTSKAARTAGFEAVDCAEENQKAKPTKACPAECYQDSGTRIGFIDIRGLAFRQVALFSIAERSFVPDCPADDSSVAQFASGISSGQFCGYNSTSNTPS